MSINRNRGPLYLQVKKAIKDRILHGIYPLGSLIPSEPQLEQEFAVSKMTVRNAVKELAQEGYVEKRSGIGTKVIRNTSFSKLSKGKRFTEVLVEEGHKIQKKLLSLKVIRTEDNSELYGMFGDMCLQVNRLYILDGHPYVHYTHYLRSVFSDEDLGDLDHQSLYELIEEHHIELEKFRDSFTVAEATEELGELLLIPQGKMLLKRIRHSYDSSGVLMEYSIGHYNTELQHYLVNYDA
ncbi:GntR family transcriptional regulator [Paenibacillus tuaregi]|uniref:GntR family transcriptional regulator n=1 Tax=Paenibacillus tuaregi TaxID=1816681 RepID=UPI0008390DA2|nr:GntR family transcriptional regulator [Paenibacillus tuaregi]